MTEERNWQKAVLEAALFQQREPASLPRLLQAPPDHVLDVIAEFEADLRAAHRGLEIRTVNGKFQLASARFFHSIESLAHLPPLENFKPKRE